MWRGIPVRGGLSIALVLIASGVFAGAQASSDPAPATVEQTNGPLAYQDAGGRLAITTIGAQEDVRAAGHVTSRADGTNCPTDGDSAAASGAGSPTGVAGDRVRSAPLKGTQAAWSADGTQLAITRRSGRRRQIFIVGSDGRVARRPLTRDPRGAFEPTWSPNGKRLAFTSMRHGHPEIYSIAADGTRERRLTVDPTGARDPDWSSGGLIAFTSARTGSRDVWVMNADGASQRVVTALPDAERDPDWKVDGAVLAFAGAADPGSGISQQASGIYILDVANLNVRRLTSGARDRFPSWAPTGGAIAFTRIAGDGRRATLVTTTDADALKRQPREEIASGSRADWGPLPVAPREPPPLEGGAVALKPVKPERGNVTVAPCPTSPTAKVAPEGAAVPQGFVVRAPVTSPVELSAEPPSADSKVSAELTGTFQIEPPEDGALTFRVAGSEPSCGVRAGGSTAVAARKRRKKRKRNTVTSKGKVRSKARHASGTSKATTWSVEETCKGSLFKVRSGTVVVEERVSGRRVEVGPGDSYLARGA